MIAAGFEIVEYEDVSHEWGKAAWKKSNDQILPIWEEEKETLDRVEQIYFNIFGFGKPRYYNDIRFMHLEEIKERFPLTCKYVDPAVYVHGITHEDLRIVRYICRRPLDK